MANFTIADLERIVEIEKGSSHDTSRNHLGDETSRNLHGVQKKIYMYALEQSKCDKEVSRGQIAKKLGLKKTGWLHDQIDDLVAAKKLTRRNGTWKNGVLMYWYTVAR